MVTTTALGSIPAAAQTLHAMGINTINVAVFEIKLVVIRVTKANTVMIMMPEGFPPRRSSISSPMTFPAPESVSMFAIPMMVAHISTGPFMMELRKYCLSMAFRVIMTIHAAMGTK